MSTMQIASTAGWTYNGTGSLATLGTYTNPDSSQKIRINSLTVYMGTVKGTCNTGTTATGNGSTISTYIYINNIKSNTVTVNNVVGTLSSSKGSYPNRSQTSPYTFTFSSEVIVNAGATFTIKIQTPSTSNRQVLALNGDRNNVGGQYMTLNYDAIPNVSPAPSNLNLRVNSFGAGIQTDVDPWANCTVSANSVFTEAVIYFIINGVAYNENGTIYSSGTTTASRRIGIRDTVCELYARARNGNSNWVESNHVTIDCTRPTVSELSLDVVTSDAGALYFRPDSNVNYAFWWPEGYNNDPGGQGGSAIRNVYTNKNVQLIPNVIENYVITLHRESTPGNYTIGNAFSIRNINTQTPSITLTGEVFGTSFSFYASAIRTCNNWRYTLQNTATGSTQTSDTLASGVSSITGLLSELEPNTQYIIKISARDYNSNLTGYSNEITFTTSGCVRIFVDGQWQLSKVYIFNKSLQIWQAATPYIFNSSTNEWDICV